MSMTTERFLDWNEHREEEMTERDYFIAGFCDSLKTVRRVITLEELAGSLKANLSQDELNSLKKTL